MALPAGKDDTHKPMRGSSPTKKRTLEVGSSATTVFVMVVERCGQPLWLQLAFVLGAGYVGFNEPELAANNEMEPNEEMDEKNDYCNAVNTCRMTGPVKQT